MKFIHFKNVDSTSTFLKRNYSKYKNFTFVSTDFQTSGHGRMGRVWASNNKENLLFSLLIKDQKLIENYASLSLASACAIYNALSKIKIKNVSIKWPNDVFVNNKKICGILLESVSNENKIDVLIIGIGLNVNQRTFENDLIHCPTSIYNELNKKVSLFKIKHIVYKEIIKMLRKIKEGDKSYLSIIKENNYLLNKEVFAEINNEKKLVKVIDVNDDNTLKVCIDDKIINISSGEISFHL